MLEKLPLELVGEHVLGYLEPLDLILLEEAVVNKKTKLFLLQLFPYCPPLNLSYDHRDYIQTLHWFNKRKCKIKAVTLIYNNTWNLSDAWNHNCTASNLSEFALNFVESIKLELRISVTITDLMLVFDNKVGPNVNELILYSEQDVTVMNTLHRFIPNITTFQTHISSNWYTQDFLSSWKLDNIYIVTHDTSFSYMLECLQVCKDLRF